MAPRVLALRAQQAALLVALLDRPSSATKAEMLEEGGRLLAFVARDTDARDVRLVRKL